MQNVSQRTQLIDRLLHWWYYLTAPSKEMADAPLHTRAAVRRARLASVIILFEIVYHLAVVGVGATSNHQLIPVLIISLSVLAIAALFNCSGRVSVAGFLAVTILEMGMFFNLISLSFFAGGLSPFDLPLYDVLVIPTLIALSLFPAWITFLIAVLNSLFIVASLMFFPKTPEMVQVLSSAPYDTWFRPVSIQFVAGLVCYFWVSHALQAIKRADVAEEVNKLTQDLALQQQVALQEKQQLEESIQSIIAVHTQVANGNFMARVPLNQKNVLWSIAGSLNNLLARLQRLREDAIQLQRTEQAIQEVIHALQQAKQQGIPMQVSQTGTMVDMLMTEMIRAKPASQTFPEQALQSSGQLLSPRDQFPRSSDQLPPFPDKSTNSRSLSDYGF